MSLQELRARVVKLDAEIDLQKEVLNKLGRDKSLVIREINAVLDPIARLLLEISSKIFVHSLSLVLIETPHPYKASNLEPDTYRPHESQHPQYLDRHCAGYTRSVGGNLYRHPGHSELEKTLANQTEDWKGVGLSKKMRGVNSHKRECPWFKRAMEQWPVVTAIQQLFPWSANMKDPRKTLWIPNQIELLLGLKGEDAAKGYWREPAIDNAIHDSEAPFRTLSPAYICHGSVFLEPVLPSHTEAWKLPSVHIPHLDFESPESKSRMPALHDNNLVRDWASYYTWRKLDRKSPVALRMDIVLTVYYLLTEVLGVVDTSKAAMKSRRTLKIHFIGAEKELNVIPLFGELALLIPNADIILTFFGQACKKLCDIAAQYYPKSLATRSTVFDYTAPKPLGGSTLRVKISGRADLYDFAAIELERPDALIAENAGLFSYIAWQIVYQCSGMAGIPWGVTEYHMTEVVEYEEHMVQWRDILIQGLRVGLGPRKLSPEDVAETMHKLAQVQARGAGLNPFLRPGLQNNTLEPRAYNGFVLRVC
ncbi:hypothetical protein K438DRAFT_1967095 [Mycena galopus ATCC 62051]|nr:hypothetical protein K438DRAFT_1967095 [Mycena galopus ATCC 62051]